MILQMNYPTIEPTSIAGILLREHDIPEQAATYARHVAERNKKSNTSMAADYLAAAAAIEEAQKQEQQALRER